MRSLEYYFTGGIYETGKSMHKLSSFGKIYEDVFKRFRNTNVTLLEIGISAGACLQLWRDYLGANANIYGADICEGALYNEERIRCFRCDVADKESLIKLMNEVGTVDIIIDDASHICSDQILTFETLFPMINENGIYLCEDTHTSYRRSYGGGYLREGTFVEYCKSLIDSMYFTEGQNIQRHMFTDTIQSITFYPSLVMIKHV